MGKYLEEAKRVKDQTDDETGNSLLSELVLRWLKEDLEERGPREKLSKPPEMALRNEIGGYGLEKRPQ